MRLLTQTPRVTRRDFQKQHAAPSHGRSRGLTVATGFRVLERKGALVLHGLCRLFWTSTRVFTPFLGPREQCATLGVLLHNTASSGLHSESPTETHRKPSRAS